MKISRRGFMKIGAATGAALAISKSSVLQSAEFAAGGKSVSVAGKEREKVPYTCLTCNIEDGGIAYLEDGRIVKLEGNPEHPGNRGKLCAKGNAGWQHVYDPDRLLYPLKRTGKRGEGKWKRITWEEALDEVASKVQAAVDSDPGTVAFHYGRNRMHGAIERFMKAIGSNTIFNHTALCESSKKIGMEPTWGPDIETPDFAHTNYILNFGSNVLEAAYFHNPYAQRVAEGKAVNKAKMVTFDVRLSNSAGFSDEWIPVFPGTDGVVALAMCNVIMNEGLADEDFINKNCNVSASELKSHLSKYTPEMAEKESGVPAETIRRIAIEFASAGPATTYTYRGPAKHVNGAYNERCTMMLNIITGNVERRGGYNLPRGLGWVNGGGPEPVPPAPSAKSVVAQPPDYPLAGHKVCQVIPYRIIDGVQKINVYFTYCHIPTFAQPDTETWKEMLLDEKLIPYHVNTSFNMDETAMLADIILPDTTFLERWDPESMPSSYIGWVGIRQPVVKSPGGMPTREVLIELGKRIKQSKQYFNGVTAEGWVRNHFDSMPGLKEEGGFDYMKKNGVYKQKGVSEENFKFREGGKVSGLKDGKLHIKAEEYEHWGYEGMPHYEPIKEHDAVRNGDKMVMTTFKWNVHTQTRTQNLKLLQEIVHKNPAWINTKTAQAKGIKEGDLIRITSKIGYIVTKAHLTEGIHPKVVAVSHSTGRKGMGRIATLNPNFAKDMGIAGQVASADDPEFKHIWWKDSGVHPNAIIPPAPDPIGGSQGWFDTVVTVEKAKSGDKYGDTKVQPYSVRKAAYEEALKLRSAKAAANTGPTGGH